jgi:hypothetical protein
MTLWYPPLKVSFELTWHMLKNAYDWTKSQLSLVVGMTNGACQGPSYLPAGVPGVSTALGQEDRLHPKGRLHQWPVGDSTEESQSRAMKTKALQRLDRWKWLGPDKIDRGKGREWWTPRPDSTNQRPRSLPHKRIRGKREGICLPDAGPRGKGALIIKRDRQSGARGSCRGRSHRGAGCRTSRHLTCNQTPAYIRGSGPLD